MNLRRSILPLLLALLAVLPAAAQKDPVSWSARLDPADARAGEAARVLLTARIDNTWLIYSMKEQGPIPLSVSLVPGKALAAAGPAIEPKPKRKHDEGFQKEVAYHAGEVVFALPVKLAAGPGGAQRAALKVRYQACDPRLCLPPKTIEVPVAFTVAAGPARPQRLKPSTAVPPQPVAGAATTPTSAGDPSASGAPPAVPAATAASPDDGDFGDRVKRAQASGLAAFLWLSLTMGFLALLTPCVFPMVPITVSFFSKRQDADDGKNLRGALAYCLGIIGTFTGLGLMLTVIFGASGIQQFATNPWINLGMAALFIVLALNLFGAFEIVLPASLVNKVGGGSRGGRFVGPMLMGLTFTLTSFTCTVPFVGTLLVATTQGNPAWPVVGMLAFSTAFASPFFLLALFPGWLARLPKSGSWLVSVKAFMGFLELAAAVKFLSNADLVWGMGLLTRPVFLSLWSTIALVAGLYLLGWLRLPHGDGPLSPGLFRRGLGVATATAGVWCLAAIGGGVSLGELDAFLPPRHYGAPAGTAAHGVRWNEDYDAAVEQARREGKALFINFTGYTCTNCRWMESHIFPRPDVVTELSRFVPVELFTDGLGARYDRNKKLQEEQFGTVALPLYVVVTPDGRKLGEFAGLTRNPQEFVDFLRKANAAAQTALREPIASGT
jgi:thiol:disulfide interchange protein